MSSVKTGDPTNNPASITIPSGGDLLKAASVNPAFEGLADKVACIELGGTNVAPYVISGRKNITDRWKLAGLEAKVLWRHAHLPDATATIQPTDGDVLYVPRTLTGNVVYSLADADVNQLGATIRIVRWGPGVFSNHTVQIRRLTGVLGLGTFEAQKYAMMELQWGNIPEDAPGVYAWHVLDTAGTFVPGSLWGG